jgi:hypothetical protein
VVYVVLGTLLRCKAVSAPRLVRSTGDSILGIGVGEVVDISYVQDGHTFLDKGGSRCVRGAGCPRSQAGQYNIGLWQNNKISWCMNLKILRDGHCF